MCVRCCPGVRLYPHWFIQPTIAEHADKRPNIQYQPRPQPDISVVTPSFLLGHTHPFRQTHTHTYTQINKRVCSESVGGVGLKTEQRGEPSCPSEGLLWLPLSVRPLEAGEVKRAGSGRRGAGFQPEANTAKSVGRGV